MCRALAVRGVDCGQCDCVSDAPDGSRLVWGQLNEGRLKRKALDRSPNRVELEATGTKPVE